MGFVLLAIVNAFDFRSEGQFGRNSAMLSRCGLEEKSNVRE